MSTSPARLLRSPLAIRRANGSTLLLRSLACQSGLRRCRHASTTSAASAMLSCVSSQPPAQSRSMSVVLYEWQASRARQFQTDPRALFDAQQL